MRKNATKPSSLMRYFSVFLLFLTFSTAGFAHNIYGVVKDNFGTPLSNASIYISGSTRGTTANAEGRYFLDVPDGNYTIVCAFVGYQRQQVDVAVNGADIEQNFTLHYQQTELKNVDVLRGAEDPAIGIIRHAIASRKKHLEEIKEWQVMVYMKGLIRTYQVPKKILGVKIEPNRDIIDSTGKGILYFSESLTRYSRRLPNDYKEEVVSAKVSGMSQGFGFNSPKDIEVNFYERNLDLQGLNSRGFISPIAENAFYFYRFHYVGTFYENGLEVNKIQVLARRQYEPTFTGGYINIIEGSWRIHSVDLVLTKTSQIELVDTLHIRQQLFPVKNNIWMPQQTSIQAGFTILGLKAGADFNAIYSDYKLDRLPSQAFKGNIVKTIDTAANKKSVEYWDSIRPAPLTSEEREDYLKKDSLEQKFTDQHYLDSLDKRSNRISPIALIFNGESHINRYKKIRVSYPALVYAVQYNTVEGWVADLSPTMRHWGDTNAFTIKPHLRYSFGNKHFNAAVSYTHTVGKNPYKRWRLAGNGGKYVYQINPANPIDPLVNTIGTLLYKRNYLKIYEKAFGELSAAHDFKNGFQMMVKASYEDRRPMENIDTSYSWVKYDDRHFSSNYPEELPPGNFIRHQALLTTLNLRWQPGQQFVQYPDRLISLGSDWPVFEGSFTKAWKGVAGSDANFSKWALGISDDLNLHLGGGVNYRFTAGGFINNDNVQLPDWQHFNGNLTIIANSYVNSFQLAPYYANSTKDRFFTTGNIEWHLNGLLTNKIPFIRRWNLGLVTGSNAFYVNSKKNYVEIFAGVENIFKIMRVDMVWGYDGFNQKPTTGIVIGFSGLITGQGVE